MNTPSIGALNTGSDYHLLDHIAPLADLLGIPLIVSEEENFQLARAYYPHVQTEYEENLDSRIEKLAERFTALIECKYWKPHLKNLFHRLHGKKMDLIFCPHGQSDKGAASPLLSPYAQQDIVLLYGDLMIKMLQDFGVWPAIDRFAVIGDYRLVHYQKYKAFYDHLAQTEIFSKLSPNQPTLLYAPTWKDADQATSFFDQSRILLSQLPDHWNLVVKVHPLLEKRNPAHYLAALNCLNQSPNTLLVSHFPPVHPLVCRIDAYLGDFSSVGYDVLSYQKPMFFFPNPKIPQGRLRECGWILDLNQPIFSFIEANLNSTMAEKQAKLYQFAFGLPQPEAQIRAAIKALLQ